MLISHKTLKTLAFLTWITGAVILSLKGYDLFRQAVALKPGALLNYLPFVVGAVVGAVKAKYLFLHACRKNLSRIDSLPEPKLWQFFRVGFFIFLFSMVTLGAWMSRAAEGNYGYLLAVASLDLALAVALARSLVGFSEGQREVGS